ncbi:MAG: globin-like protein [Verrucomicrobiales bacterium]|nr:globin-like protein [Verrucomicrobiales bacterium]
MIVPGIRLLTIVPLVVFSLMISLLAGCGTQKQKAKNTDFFTSGSKDADQRASQRMAKEEQLSGGGEGAGQKNVKQAKIADKENPASTNKAAVVEGKLSLFDRLGGDEGLTKIVDDFIPRALQDPRVNWQRKGVTRGGFSFKRSQPVTWDGTPANIALLKKHFVQFLALATGGPAHYDGKEIKSSHAAMHISNAEFDATVGDLKASLDKLQIPNKEQKELLAIAESTRPQIVVER